MHDFINYMKAQAERREAYEKYSYAGQLLENRGIKERLAEVKSQAEPFNTLINASMDERDRLYAAAFYVAVGRMP
jgi:hypothetical protein